MSSFPTVLQKSLGSDKEVIDMCTLGLSTSKIYDLIFIFIFFTFHAFFNVLSVT